MSHTGFESQSPASPNLGGSQAASFAPRSARRSRLQFEKLENRVVPTAVAEVGAGEPGSEVMQAAQMSAFFQQSALYICGQPTSDPTTPWVATREDLPVERESQAFLPAWSTARHRELVDDLVSRSDEVGEGLLPRRPGAGSGSLRVDLGWPEQVFAPYVDVTLWPTFDLAHTAETQGIKYFNLAFIAADAHDRPSWAGHDEYTIGSEFDLALRRQVADLRAIGGDVAVSFGGPRHLELAQVITDVGALTQAYRAVVDAYGLKRIDMDLEGSALSDPASIERRSAALKQLQQDLLAEGRHLTIWFTLPAEPSGLTEGAARVVESALSHGIDLGGVNIRPIVDAEHAAPQARESAGVLTIESAISVFYQLHGMQDEQETAAATWRKIGVTPTVGAGEAPGEVFTPANAEGVFDFARQQGMGMIGIWTINRDQFDSHSGAAPSGTSTGIEQDAFEFSDIFKPFTER